MMEQIGQEWIDKEVEAMSKPRYASSTLMARHEGVVCIATLQPYDIADNEQSPSRLFIRCGDPESAKRLAATLNTYAKDFKVWSGA